MSAADTRAAYLDVIRARDTAVARTRDLYSRVAHRDPATGERTWETSEEHGARMVADPAVCDDLRAFADALDALRKATSTTTTAEMRGRS